MAPHAQLWYNHEMLRYLRPTAIALTIVLGVALYREWVLRNQPLLFQPLGFFETAMNPTTLENHTRDPRSWVDPVASLVVPDAEFERMAERAEERTADVLVKGATFGGFAAALSASGDGAATILFDEREWKSSMQSEAANFIVQRTLPEAPGSDIERELIAHMQLRSTSDIMNGTPAWSLQFFEAKAAAATGLDILDEYALVAMAANPDGTVHRALLRAVNGTGALAVRFSYFIDGTRDGAGLAQAGVPTTASLDDATAVLEPLAMPPEARRALAEGYTMSGRFTPGIGKRLENGTTRLGILDRGFHGTYVPIDDHDPCWERSNTASIMVSGSPVLRARSIGCAARATYKSNFIDTVEVFAINHANDAMNVTVTMGRSRMALRIESHWDPRAQFVRLGAFPVGPDSPLAFAFSSVLPTNRLDGLIIRKLNTGALGAEASFEGSSPAMVDSADWHVTTYDAYVSTSGSVPIATLILDGTQYRTERLGPGTYAVKNVPLKGGRHIVRAPDGIGSLAFTLVPTAPGSIPLAAMNETDGTPPTWRVVPDRDADVLFTIPVEACSNWCSYRLIEEESRRELPLGSALRGTELVASTYPLGVARMIAGKAYILIAEGGHDGAYVPTLSPIDASSALHAINDDSAYIEPPREGLLYDVWVRSVRASPMTVTMNARTRSLPGESDAWRYVGTEPLSARGTSVTGGGKIEMLAIPNTMVDAYHIPLPPAGASTSPVEVPTGTYAMASFGLDNPNVVTATNDEGFVQSLSFAGHGGTFHATQEYEHSSATVFAQASPWAQRLVLFERIALPEDASVRISQAALLAMDPRPAPGGMRGSRGTMLFEPRPEGIAPVTIGTLWTAPLEKHIREAAKDAFFLLRHGKTNVRLESACDRATDPRCDLRRYVRAQSVFGTVDGLSPQVSYAEGRRIAGHEMVTTSGAYVLRQQCTTCFDQCIPGTIIGRSCVFSHSVSVPPNAVLSVRSASGATRIVSPREDVAGTLPGVLGVLRSDRLLGRAPTYLEAALPPRETSISLDMMVADGHENVLAGSTTVSASAAAAKALRLPTTELALGSVAGHAAAFALLQERAPLWLIRQSPDAYGRLQRYLIDKGVRVLPVTETDPLASKAIQRRVLDGLAALVPVWKPDGATFTVSNPPVDGATVFGTADVDTVREALELLPGSPTDDTPLSLLRFALEIGFLNEKVFGLQMEEIMALPLDESHLLKADYLLRARQ